MPVCPDEAGLVPAGIDTRGFPGRDATLKRPGYLPAAPFPALEIRANKGDHQMTQVEQEQQRQQVEQQLRQNWRQLRYNILDQFGQVSTADLDAATDINDLVARIADKTHHSERYVENRLRELAGVGGGRGGLSGERFGGGQQGQQGQQGRPFGSQ
jgi:hypothetical protein